MKSRDAILVALLLWWLWKRSETVVTTMCYIDPDTGECLPVWDESIPGKTKPPGW